MNLPKISVKNLALLVMIAVMTALQSCSNDASGVLDRVGNDAQGVVLIRPMEILKSLDAKEENGKLVLPKWIKKNMSADDSKQLNRIADIEGIDRDLVAMIVFENQPYGIIRITDESKFIASMKKFGFKKEKDGKRTILINNESEEDSYYCAMQCIIIDEGYAFACDYHKYEGSKSKCINGLEDVIAAGKKPLKDWKRDALLKYSSCAVSAFVEIDEKAYSACVAGGVEFSGAKATLKVECLGNGGKEQNWVPGYTFNTLGKEVKNIGTKDLFAFAFGGVDGRLPFELIRGLLPYYMRSTLDSEYMENLNGAFFVSAAADNVKSESALQKPKNWHVAAGVGFTGERAERTLTQLTREAKDNGLRVSSDDDDSYSLKVPEVGTIYAKADNNMIVVKNYEGSASSALSPGKVDDCIAYGFINLPADFFVFKQAKVKTGIKVNGMIKQSSGEIEIEFTDSKDGFLNTFGQFITAMDGTLGRMW